MITIPYRICFDTMILVRLILNRLPYRNGELLWWAQCHTLIIPRCQKNEIHPKILQEGGSPLAENNFINSYRNYKQYSYKFIDGKLNVTETERARIINNIPALKDLGNDQLIILCAAKENVEYFVTENEHIINLKSSRKFNREFPNTRILRFHEFINEMESETTRVNISEMPDGRRP